MIPNKKKIPLMGLDLYERTILETEGVTLGQGTPSQTLPITILS